MRNIFGQGFGFDVWERILVACNLKAPEVIKLQAEGHEKSNKFLAMLSPEARAYYLDVIDPMRAEIESYKHESIYKQGFKDREAISKLGGM